MATPLDSTVATAEANSEQRNERPPGPGGLPLVGNTHQFVRDPLGYFEDCARQYGDVVYYEMAGRSIYQLSHPDHVERVLLTDHDKFRKGELVRNTLGDVIGNGLVVSEGEFWREQRMRMQSVFTPASIQSFAETMADYADDHASEWTAGKSVDVVHEMKRLTMQIMARTLFGVDIRDQQSAIRDVGHSMNAKLDAGSVDWLLPNWVPTPTNVRFRRSMDDLDDLVQELIQTGGASGGDSPERPDGVHRELATDGGALEDNLLSILLSARDDEDGMSDEQLRDELVTFLFAGHETTAMALSYTWLLLSRNPDCRERFHEEVDEVVGDGVPGFADVPQLEYTDRVLRESLRVLPPVTRIPREATEDVEVGGYTVPEGATVMLPQWVVHNDARWYESPEEFRPERWADGREEDRPDYAYFPFGGGPRHCIGMRFAMTEAKLILATLARDYRLDCVDDGELDFTVSATIQPKGGIDATLAAR